nr:ABC transporter substrate-binding protein [uncultured Blautia sp.]
MKRRIIGLLLAVTVTAGMCACGQEEKETQPESAGAKEYDQVTYAYATMNNVPTEESVDAVEEKLNEITREKIGVEVTLKPIALADYSQSVSLSLQAGEKIDVFQSIYDFTNCVSTGMAMDITELGKEYASDTIELVGEEWLKASSYEGKLYGIPTYKPVAAKPYFVCRKDIAEELGLDLSGIKSSSELTDVFSKVQEAHPEMTMLAPLNQGKLGEHLTWYGVDWLSDSDEKAFGVLMGDDTTVKNLYASDLFKDSCDLAREWYNAGYVMKDAATTTSTNSELMGSGKYFGFFTSNATPAEDLAQMLSGMYGNYQLQAIPLGKPYLSTASINTVTWMLASNTKVPEAAMKFLDLTYNDPDVCNLLIFGIEGRDYVLDQNGYASYPEGEDAATVPYTAQLSNGILGNSFIMYPITGTDKESMPLMLEENKSADISPVMGFVFDSSHVGVQYTAVNNVASQYLPGLLCGSVDPETEIPKFLQALDDAGCQDIIDAKQEQLNDWLEENK